MRYYRAGVEYTENIETHYGPEAYATGNSVPGDMITLSLSAYQFMFLRRVQRHIYPAPPAMQASY